MKQTEAIQQAREALDKEASGHTLTILHDDGLYKHLRMSTNNLFHWRWDVVTWPGYLTIVGDFVDEGWTFTREADMIAWFRGGISPSYQAQKLVSGCKDPYRWSPELFLQTVETLAGEAGLEYSREAAEEVSESQCLATSWAMDNIYNDAWEWECRELDFYFILSLVAIDRTLQEYRKGQSCQE